MRRANRPSRRVLVHLGAGMGLTAGLLGCGGELREDVARQAADLSAVRGRVVQIQTELQGLREDVVRLRDAIEAEARRSAARAEEDARTREAADRAATRLAAAEKRVDEIGETMAGVEASVGSLADQVARLDAATTGLPSLRPGGTRARRPAAAVSPEELFDRGMESFRAGEIGQAVLDFEELVDRYAGHPLAPGAHFWIGEAYFRARDFEHASVAYQKAVELAPTGDRTPDALLRLGLALRSLRREDRARETWGRLIRDFPESEAAQRARAVLREPSRTSRPPSAPVEPR